MFQNQRVFYLIWSCCCSLNEVFFLPLLPFFSGEPAKGISTEILRFLYEYFGNTDASDTVRHLNCILSSLDSSSSCSKLRISLRNLDTVALETPRIISNLLVVLYKAITGPSSSLSTNLMIRNINCFMSDPKFIPVGIAIYLFKRMVDRIIKSKNGKHLRLNEGQNHWWWKVFLYQIHYQQRFYIGGNL